MEPNSPSPEEKLSWEEVEQAHAAVDKVTQELYTFSKLLPAPKDTVSSHRNKRGRLV
jgi:hypothetical protein